jgi:hypothetical protein
MQSIPNEMPVQVFRSRQPVGAGKVGKFPA